MPAHRKLRIALCLFGIAAVFSFATTARAEDAKPEPRAPFTKGPIEKIDLAHKLLTLKTRDRLETFTWTERTYVFRGKEKISVDKLKQGEIVALRFYTDEQGQLVAQRIKAAPPPQEASPNPTP
jgi:Cu/Ag efflux protein CusF